MNVSTTKFAFGAGLLATALAAAPSPVRAQDLSPQPQLAPSVNALPADEADDVQHWGRKVDAQLPGSQGGRLLPSVKILTGIEDTTAQITFSTHSEKSSSLSNDDFALTFSAPVSKKTKRADFLTQDGLPGKVSAGATFTHSFVNLTGIVWPSGSIAALTQEAYANCLASTDNPALSAKDRKALCDGMNTRQLGDKYLSKDKQEAMLQLFNQPTDAVARRSYTVLSVSGAIGTETFEYFDPATLASTSKRKTALSLGAWLGVLPQLKSPFFLIGGFEAKRSYTADKDATFCPAPSGPAPVKCTTGAFAPPAEEIDYKLSAKVRFTTNLGRDGDKLPLGAELSASYDLHDDTWGVELPVYVFIDKDNGLTGGLRGAYDSKNDKLELSIFIGKTFDFLKF